MGTFVVCITAIITRGIDAPSKYPMSCRQEIDSRQEALPRLHVLTARFKVNSRFDGQIANSC
jgi:hypothetical protein